MPGLLSYDYGDAASGDIEVRKDGTLVPLNTKMVLIDWENDFSEELSNDRRRLRNDEIIRQIYSCFDHDILSRSNGLKVPVLKRIPVLQVYVLRGNIFRVMGFYYPIDMMNNAITFAELNRISEIVARFDTGQALDGKQHIVYLEYYKLTNSSTSSASLEAEE